MNLAQEKLRDLILRNASALSDFCSGWADPVTLLAALAEKESIFTVLNKFRYEKNYEASNNPSMAPLIDLHGDAACGSYSSFQIMFPTAVELGFDPKRKPEDLSDDECAIHWVIEYCRRRLKGCKSIEQFADGFNSGNFKDANVPHEYIKKFKAAYAVVDQKYNLKKGDKNV